jgi:hypothetical protein
MIVSVPYLYAFQQGGSSWRFSGFLLNPIDGHSYLAKMRLGLNGYWKFVLPYSAVPGEGAYLFLFYIFLGHIARILNLPLILVFHLFRVAGSIFLIWALWRLFASCFKETKYRLLGFGLAVFGSGMGWLAIMTGSFTSDFWVAEAYPFLSMYANPHFPIGLGLIILALIPGKYKQWHYLLLGIILAVVQPFSIVILLFLFLALFIFQIISIGEFQINELVKSKYFSALVGIGALGGVFLVYQYWSIINDPALAVWNAQNRTPSPVLFDFLISFSPVIFLSLVGIKYAWRSESGRILVVWVLVSIVLVMIPWNLQRRFLTGLYVPLVGLAVFGIVGLEERKNLNFRISILALVILSIPTNLIVILSGFQAINQLDRNIYISTSLKDSLDWISHHTDEKSLILTDQSTGLFIPSITGRRVIYGHPFETINAEDELEFVSHFYGDNLNSDVLESKLESRGIDYLLIQDRIIYSELDDWMTLNFPLIYEQSGTAIYQLTSP